MTNDKVCQACEFKLQSTFETIFKNIENKHFRRHKYKLFYDKHFIELKFIQLMLEFQNCKSLGKNVWGFYLKSEKSSKTQFYVERVLN